MALRVSRAVAPIVLLQPSVEVRLLQNRVRERTCYGVLRKLLGGIESDRRVWENCSGGTYSKYIGRILDRASGGLSPAEGGMKHG
jgi:hypothetical protein